jgi:hypothetical protein
MAELAASCTGRRGYYSVLPVVTLQGVAFPYHVLKAQHLERGVAFPYHVLKAQHLERRGLVEMQKLLEFGYGSTLICI